MPATRPRASFEAIAPNFDLGRLVETTPNFSYVDRISVDMIDQQGIAAFEKLVLLHVVIGGKPLVIDGFEGRLDPWTFTPKWLRDNCGEKVENARVLTDKSYLPLTMGHYLKNMAKLTNQFFEKEGAHKDKARQRVYLKDIDCPDVWQDKLREHIPSTLYYLNESTGELGGPGAMPDNNGTVPGKRMGKGIARAGDLMSSLPPDMRAENLMCYIGHEGTYTPAHREMCASLGHNIMVEASDTVSDDGKSIEKPGSSIWFMTESKDRHIVSEYWLSVLGHDIEVETHFAQVVAWKKAPFNVYVVEQRPGDFILIPPLAPHQVWNRGTRTMKVAWNRTTVETLEMALNEALPRSRIVCRDEQYKNKAIVYYTLQKYSSLLTMAQQQSTRLPPEAANQLLYSGKVKQLQKDFKRLFTMYKQILLSEMFSPEDHDAPKTLEYIPFDSNVTCAYCRGNIFNRFLTCGSCKDLLGHNVTAEDGGEGDPYDVCMDCYAMGRSCGCISGLKWVEQFKWKELATKYESWRKLILAMNGGQMNNNTPLPLIEEKRKLGKKTLAEVCKEQLKRRPWKDVHKVVEEDEGEDDEEIVVGDDGMVKKVKKKRSKTWLKTNGSCHVCANRHPNWKMAFCTTCEKGWCYGTLWRGWDKMPLDIMEDMKWSCPHCLGICFAGNCRREGKQEPYEPKGTLLGHDTKKVADARSVEALVDFSVSNLTWLKDDTAVDRTESSRVKRAKAEAQRAKEVDHALDEDDQDDGAVEQTQVDYEYSNSPGNAAPIDPALGGSGSNEVGPSSRPGGLEDDEDALAHQLQALTSTLPPPAAMVAGAPAHGAPDGYAPIAPGYPPPAPQMYPQPSSSNGYAYPGYGRPESVEPVQEEAVGMRPFMKRTREDDEDGEFDADISMSKGPKAKKPRMSAAGFRSSDLAEGGSPFKAMNEAQRQFGKEKERKALDKAKLEGRFIMLQAALKGKKMIVKLAISGARLAQMLAQQAARAALGEEDADGEVEGGGAATAHGDHEEADSGGVMLLKSDIRAPVRPKTKDAYREYNEQRKDEGHILTGKTKKALIPVEKDNDYSTKTRNDTPLDKREKRKGRWQGRYHNVQYEEVDVGSDEEVGDNIRGAARDEVQEKEGRRLPGYLQSRHEEDGDDGPPAELPEGFRDSSVHNRAPRVRPRRVEAGAKSAEAESSHTTGRSAGKRPSMRPSLTAEEPHGIPNGDDDNDDTETAAMIDAAANGDFMDIDDTIALSAAAVKRLNSATGVNGTPKATPAAVESTQAQPKPSTGRPRGKLPKVRETASQQRANAVAEENRKAKLQALEMVDDEEFEMGAGGW